MTAGVAFRNRLSILMKGEKPYSWARKVGIEKGLFQYYWQKGRIPTYDNLMKIQKHTGCSLDWLLAGKSPVVDKVDGLEFVADSGAISGKVNLRRVEAIKTLNSIFASGCEQEIEALEVILQTLAPIEKPKKRKEAA